MVFSVVEVVQPAAEVVRVIAHPRVRVTAPRFMGWVGVNTILPHPLKQAMRRLTKTDSIFLHPDPTARSDYNSRIGQ